MLPTKHKSSLPYTLHNKKGKQYVCVSVPANLRHLYGGPQIRRSTGTSDRAVALERAAEKYRDIIKDLEDKESQLDPFVEGIRDILQHEGADVNEWYRSGQIKLVVRGDKTAAARMTGSRITVDVEGKLATLVENWSGKTYLELAGMVTGLGYALLQTLLSGLSQNDHSAIMEATKPVGIPPSVIGKAYRDDPELAEAMFKNAPATTQHVELQTAKTLMPTFSKWAERYKADKADKDSADVQHKRAKSCAMFLKVCGDFPLNEYDKVHMLDMARYMDDDEDGKQWAHKTIKNYVRYTKQAFDYEGETRNDLGKKILSTHPFHNLRLGEFGAPAKPYISFNSDELHSIFNQELPRLDKLLLAILVTTGMRLDEASLMTWERVIKHEGTLCFALVDQINGNNQEQVLVKNTGSKRFIPIPEVIKPLLGNFGVGRIFSHRIDKEGKSEAAASDALMPYVRKVCAHPQKVLHSFRHTFIDLTREMDITDVETRKFITGHSLGDVGGEYGSGPSMGKRLAILNGIKHPWLV